MNNLVEFKKGQAMTTSLKFAEEFKIQHIHVLEKIRKLTIEYSIVKNEFKKDIFVNERNREYPFYWITKDGYLTLVMNMQAKGESAKILFEKKQLFIKAFNLMEEELLRIKTNHANELWLDYRKLGKEQRKELTDTIQEFVEYATKQGSQSAKMYYMNITKMEYKALQFTCNLSDSLRDQLDLMEQAQLGLAERLVKDRLKKYMDDGLHYKVIYQYIKQDVMRYANSLFITDKERSIK